MESPSGTITQAEQLRTLRDTTVSAVAGIVAYYIVQYAGLPADQQVTLTSAIMGIVMYVIRIVRSK